MPARLVTIGESRGLRLAKPLLQQQSTSLAVLAEHLGLIGSFATDSPDSGATLLDTGPLVPWFDRSDQDLKPLLGSFSGTRGLSYPSGRC